VATDSSDHTININKTEIEDAPGAGRNYLSLLRVLPGTQFTTTTDTRGSTTPKSNAGSGVNGTPGQLLMTLDGVAQQDNGNPRTGGFLAPSVDAIQEVQVLVSNYSAQYGSRSGGQLNVTVKNGTNQFHGSLYWYLRHEMFNANEWFNNKNHIAKPRYRYQNPGGTFGGPVLLPWTHFNRTRNKLFFFFSEDYLYNVNSPTSSTVYTMPTALERSGDFSQTVTSTGVLIPIKDPSNGGAQFPKNMIPGVRIDTIGAAMMNLFPQPFTTDPSGLRGYNSTYQFLTRNPREDRILRVDYNFDPKTTLYVRLIQDYQDEQAMTGALHLSGGWGQGYTDYAAPSFGAVVNLIHTFRPNLINEFTAGINHFHEQLSPTNSSTFAAENLLPLNDPKGNAISLPNAFPDANILKLRPEISFGTSSPQSAGQAVTAPPTFGYDGRWPFFGNDSLTNITNNVTWIKGKHNLKFGFYFERGSRDTANTGTGATSAGQYFFGSDTANPYDTGYAFSNLLLGTVQAYSQDNQKLLNHGRYKQFEWFAQETWKVSHRLTLDLGIRFQVLGPVTSAGISLNAFSDAAYNRSKAGQLLYPACTVTVTATGSCPAANEVALNPATGVTYAYGRAGLFDPTSYPAGGNPYTGMLTYNSHFWTNPGVAFGPRVGFAWDVLGDGKLALRGGFGIFYDRAFASGVETQGFLIAAPPTFQSPVFYNTTFSGLGSATGFLSPQTAYGGGQHYLNPTVYNFSLGIQRDLGKGLILDASFVGNVVHHGFGGGGAGSNGPVDGNPVAPYTDWLPVPNAATTAQGQVKAFLDPTSKNGGTSAFYAANIIRALAGGYPGYGAINLFNNNGESYYDALQVQVNKRFGRRLQFSSNYTFAKQITYTHSQFLSDYLTRNVVGRPHAVNATFGYSIPDGSFFWKNPVTSAVLDGWHFSGVAAFFMGTPLTIGCAATGAPIGWPTGTPADAPGMRCQMNGSLWLPSGATPSSVGSTSDPRLWYPFAVSNFTLPSLTSLGVGNTPLTLTYGPGFENFDLALYKDFRLGKETRVLQFRVDTYNTFNHFNPGNPNTSLSFPYANYAIGANTNASFGAITTAQNTARHMSASLRFRF
jgi:hypothetical protein